MALGSRLAAHTGMRAADVAMKSVAWLYVPSHVVEQFMHSDHVFASAHSLGTSDIAKALASGGERLPAVGR